jgi:hypothetical protein
MVVLFTIMITAKKLKKASLSTTEEKEFGKAGIKMVLLQQTLSLKPSKKPILTENQNSKALHAMKRKTDCGNGGTKTDNSKPSKIISWASLKAKVNHGTKTDAKLL